MSLKLKLKPHERIIVNGCIMRNDSNRRMSVEIENHSDILRGSEMLDADSANTPVKRICYLVQIALVSRNHREQILSDIRAKISEVREILEKSHGESLDQIMNLIDAGEFYLANRRLQAIANYEAVLLNLPQERVFLASGRKVEDDELIREKAS